MTGMKLQISLSEIGAKLVQCSTDHDAGEQLLGDGEPVALLRFKCVEYVSMVP